MRAGPRRVVRWTRAALPRRPAAAPPIPPPVPAAPRAARTPPPRLPPHGSPPSDGPGGNPAPVRPSPAVSAIPRAYILLFVLLRSPPLSAVRKGSQGGRTPTPVSYWDKRTPRSGALAPVTRSAVV